MADTRETTTSMKLRNRLTVFLRLDRDTSRQGTARIQYIPPPRCVLHQELKVGPITSATLIAPKLGVYYPVTTMLGPSKRVDFELAFAPSALDKLASASAEVDLERAHVVLPDGKRYAFFPDWRDHTWERYTWTWHPNAPGNREGLGIRYAPLGRVIIEAASAGYDHLSFFDILRPSEVDTDHPYFRRCRPELGQLDNRSQAPLRRPLMVTHEFLPSITVTAPDQDSCDRALQTVEQVCGRALRTFREERGDWAEWEKQCVAGNRALHPGTNKDFTRVDWAKHREEFRRMTEQLLEEPRRLLANPDLGIFEAMEYLEEEVLWTHSMLGGIEVYVAPNGVHHSALKEYLERFPRAEKLYPRTVRAATAIVIPEWERLGIFVPQEAIGHPTLRVLEHELLHLLFHLVTPQERSALRRYCRETVKERRPVPYISSLGANGHNEHGTALEIVPTCGEMYMGSEGRLGQEWHHVEHPVLDQFFEKYVVR